MGAFASRPEEAGFQGLLIEGRERTWGLGHMTPWRGDTEEQEE